MASMKLNCLIKATTKAALKIHYRGFCIILWCAQLTPEFNTEGGKKMLYVQTTWKNGQTFSELNFQKYSIYNTKHLHANI